MTNGYNQAKIEDHDKRFDRMDDKLDNIETKVDSIKTEISYFKGVSASIGAIAGVLASLVTKYIIGK